MKELILLIHIFHDQTASSILFGDDLDDMKRYVHEKYPKEIKSIVNRASRQLIDYSDERCKNFFINVTST